MLKTIDDISKLKSANYRGINEEAVQALMDSIREVGVREPIRVFDAEDSKELIIIAGHHRVEAVRRLKAINPGAVYPLQAFVTKGKKTDLQTADASISMVLGNVFTPSARLLDRALGYQQLRSSGFPVASIARIAGVSESLIHKNLAVADLPESVREWLQKNPGKRDAAVYNAAAVYKRDSKSDPIALLEPKVKKNNKKTSRSIDLAHFAEQLKTKIKLPDTTIEKILCLL